MPEIGSELKLAARRSSPALEQEQLRLSPQSGLERVWQHLIIPPGRAITPLERHNGDDDSAMAPACRERLRQIVWQEIVQLEQLLGWDCSDWLRI